MNAQTLGGNAVFGFLGQPNTAQLSALGGVNISAIGNDVGMSFPNPALLRPGMHKQVNTSFNAFLAGIRNYSATGAYHFERSATSLAAGVNYFDYGTIPQTDASGNVLGSFRPVDYVVQLMASRRYHERFWYGGTMKYLRSGYGPYTSSGIAFDIGISYYDSANGLQVSLLAKNMGTQLKAYNGSRKEELPFDLQAGITKRLRHAPLQFSLTAHHLQQFNQYYNDTLFRSSEGEPGYAAGSAMQKIFSHLVLSAQAFLNEKLHVSAGYHFQRRQDLNAFNYTSGLNGFTFGASVLLRKIHLHYATGFYQRNLFHQLSLGFNWGGAL
ncbi:type IX secretion system protein PorQ [Sediminibacterium sp. WSJ-3]|nr:type IX secretion system protein PorQ [Sediminibacterium soli]